jgi:hypothetical protein
MQFKKKKIFLLSLNIQYFLLTGLERRDRDIRERGAHSSLPLHSGGPTKVTEAGLNAQLANLVLLDHPLQLLPDGGREDPPQLVVEGLEALRVGDPLNKK